MTTADLASRQADLVAALVLGGPAPAGFDPRGVALTARTLVRKRWSSVRRHWPVLAAALRHEHGETGSWALFEAWAQAQRDRGRHPGSGFVEGLAFAAWLESQEQLPEVATLEVASARLGWAHVDTEQPLARRRRWFGLAVGQARGVQLVAIGWRGRYRIISSGR